VCHDKAENFELLFLETLNRKNGMIRFQICSFNSSDKDALTSWNTLQETIGQCSHYAHTGVLIHSM